MQANINKRNEIFNQVDRSLDLQLVQTLQLKAKFSCAPCKKLLLLRVLAR